MRRLWTPLCLSIGAPVAVSHSWTFFLRLQTCKGTAFCFVHHIKKTHIVSMFTSDDLVWNIWYLFIYFKSINSFYQFRPQEILDENAPDTVVLHSFSLDSSDEDTPIVAPSRYFSGLDHLLSDASSRTCTGDEGNICISKKLYHFGAAKYCTVKLKL